MFFGLPAAYVSRRVALEGSVRGQIRAGLMLPALLYLHDPLIPAVFLSWNLSGVKFPTPQVRSTN